MDAAIRGAGALPAWIGLVDGLIVVGLDRPQLERFAVPGSPTKVARRDVPVAVAARALGATTVSATIWAAHAAGVRVAATGGIGGVHLGSRPDVSADLLELARTPTLLVCSGPKSIVDPVATAERLEQLGVAVVGYGVDRMPAFLAREGPVDLEHRVDSPAEAAALAEAQAVTDAPGAILVCNPPPRASALTAAEVEDATHRAQERMLAAGITGKAATPFLLAAIAEATGGRSLEANLDLLEANALLAAEIAVALSATRSAG
jgi:pseudouridine-5'-phosphate glycosidase